MPPTTLQALRRTNIRVRELVTRLQPDEGQPLANCQDFEELQRELTRAAELLRRVSPESMRDLEMAKEVAVCRSSLEELHQQLPKIQGRLLAEKARLESERSHLGAAAAWADASRRTL